MNPPKPRNKSFQNAGYRLRFFIPIFLSWRKKSSIREPFLWRNEPRADKRALFFDSAKC